MHAKYHTGICLQLNTDATIAAFINYIFKLDQRKYTFSNVVKEQPYCIPLHANIILRQEAQIFNCRNKTRNRDLLEGDFKVRERKCKHIGGVWQTQHLWISPTLKCFFNHFPAAFRENATILVSNFSLWHCRKGKNIYILIDYMVNTLYKLSFAKCQARTSLHRTLWQPCSYIYSLSHMPIYLW